MTSRMTEYKIITSVERKRRWSLEDKRQIIEETYIPGASVSQVARKYDIYPSQLFYWRRRMEQGALKGISTEEELVPKSQIKELEKRIRELERILGKKTLENEILREGIKIGREKKLISRQPLPGLEDLESER
jgi:transposase